MKRITFVGGLGFCLGLAVAASALATSSLAAQGSERQEIVRTGSRLQVSAATLFSFNREDAFCPIGNFVDATQFAVRYYDAGAERLRGYGVEFTHVADGQFPWPWADRAAIPQDHDGGLRVTANAYVVAQQGERVDVDLVIGAGLRRWNAGDGEAEFEVAPQLGVYRIQEQTNPILTYGFLVDISLTDALSLQGQARANTTFTGDLDVLGPNDEPEIVSVGTQTFIHMTAGLGLRVGGR